MLWKGDMLGQITPKEGSYDTKIVVIWNCMVNMWQGTSSLLTQNVAKQSKNKWLSNKCHACMPNFLEGDIASSILKVKKENFKEA